jgi:hypothetical protein
MSENRSEQSRYLSADEQRQVNEYADQYRENPPDFADQITDDLDRLLLQSEPIPTLETVNALAYTRRVEAERRVGSQAIPENVRQACANDDAMASLDDVLWQNVRDQAGITEDGGWAHLDKTCNELTAGQKASQKNEARAAQERKATARRFMGTGFSQERTITAEEFYRRKR